MTPAKQALDNLEQYVNEHKIKISCFNEIVAVIRADLATRPAPSAQVEGDVAEALAAFDNDEGSENIDYAIAWLSYVLSPDSLKPSHKRKFDAICTLIQAAQLPKVEEVTVEEFMELFICGHEDAIYLAKKFPAGLKIIPTQEK